MSNLLFAIATGVDTLEERKVRVQRRVELAQSSNEADLVRAVSTFGLDGCVVVFRTACCNPATTIKVAEAALRELRRFLDAGWDSDALAAQRQWRHKFVELVAADSDATEAQVKRACELLSKLRPDRDEYARLKKALTERVPA